MDSAASEADLEAAREDSVAVKEDRSRRSRSRRSRRSRRWRSGGLEGGGTRPLIGAVMDKQDGGFTLETQQGPLPIATNDETVIIETRQGTVADLEAGMRVTVIGPADEEGAIDARVVNVIPEGLEDIRGFGGGGRNAVGGDSAGP